MNKETFILKLISDELKELNKKVNILQTEIWELIVKINNSLNQ